MENPQEEMLGMLGRLCEEWFCGVCVLADSSSRALWQTGALLSD